MWRDHLITVSPVDGGWSVRCDDDMQPLMFLSGARAEAHARNLAQRFAAFGDDVQVVVQDRQRAVIGSTRYRARNAVGELGPAA